MFTIATFWTHRFQFSALVNFAKNMTKKKSEKKDLKERQVYFVCSWRILLIMVLPLGMDLGVWEDWFYSYSE